ncbi:hypothetical protein STEG23_020571 [Scotinomys teguina]
MGSRSSHVALIPDVDQIRRDRLVFESSSLQPGDSPPGPGERPPPTYPPVCLFLIAPLRVGEDPTLSQASLLRLYHCFQALDREEKGFEVLRLMVGVQVTDEQLESITDRTVQEADEDGDGAVSFMEFTKSLEKMNIEQKMSIRILK